MEEFADLDDFISKLNDYGNDKDLWDEGIELYFEGRKIIGFEFDGNMTLKLIGEEDEDGNPI